MVKHLFVRLDFVFCLCVKGKYVRILISRYEREGTVCVCVCVCSKRRTQQDTRDFHIDIGMWFQSGCDQVWYGLECG